jgi:monoamine oxidase
MSTSLFARLSRMYGRTSRLELTRREALQAAAAASALAMISCTPARHFASASGKRIIIIGAGFSGLACGDHLKRLGYDVMIVEARTRVGGRVVTFSDMIPGRTVEGGGDLIGTNHPLWEAYRKRFGLTFIKLDSDAYPEGGNAGGGGADEEIIPIILRGRSLSREEGKKLYDDMDRIFAAITADAETINAEAPWLSPRAAELDAMTMAARLAQLEGDELARYAVGVQLASNNGAPLDRQSYLGNLAQVKGGGGAAYWTDSENRRCEGGNQRLATRLAEAIGASRILLGVPVRSVRTTDAGTGGVRVTLADGRTLEADDVILSVPPSVWHTISFGPALPPTLAPQMGTGLKYLAQVNSRFWEAGKLSADAFGDDLFTMTWESTHGQPPSPSHHACLVGFAGGPYADRLKSREPRLREAAKDNLNRFYPGFKDAFVADRVMDWPADPLTQAAYSFPSPGQVTTIGPALRSGVGRLHFAGEHCCYKFVGYMEGALDSGVAAATRLATRDGVRS